MDTLLTCGERRIVCLPKIAGRIPVPAPLSDASLSDCYICHHTYPALLVCSRCSVACAVCNQALDAARYAFLHDAAASCRSLSMDGNATWFVPSSTCQRRARSFDEAIDLAMHAHEESPHANPPA